MTNPDETTTYHYDLLGRKTQVDDPSGSTTFEYDLWDHLTALNDANNQRSEFDYDIDGKLTIERRPMLEEMAYEYDLQGRLWTITDANQQSTEYGYDARGRLDTIAYHDGKTVTLSYDRDGNLAGYDDGVTSATYSYDAVGRKLTETVDYGPFQKSFSYTYYNNGQKQTFTAPDSSVYSYSYGTNNQLLSVQIPNLGAIAFSDYDWTRVGTVSYPGGVVRSLGYDDLMRPASLSVAAPDDTPLMNYAYSYDPAGNILTKSTEHGTYGYDYDLSSRLTVADNPMLDDETYDYDAVGNRTSASNATGAISHNLNNELTAYGELSFDYDANGNLTRKSVGTAAVNYIYNAAKRLIRVEDDLTGLVIAEYAYDPFGRRLWKEVNDVRTYFFYSDEGLIAEYDETGTEIRSYGYKPDSTWGTDPLFLKKDGQYYWYQNDHLGTPQKIVAQDGAVVWSAQYTAFGDATISVETITNNLRFPGQYFDAETGLHYNWSRYYDSGIGRYVRVDPVGFDGADVNLYGYVKNKPTKRIDFLGLIPPTIPFDRLLEDMIELFPEDNSGYIGTAVGMQWIVNGKIVTKIKGTELYISSSPNPLAAPREVQTSILFVWRKGNVNSNLLRLDFHAKNPNLPPDPITNPEYWHWNRNEVDILKDLNMGTVDHQPTKIGKYAGKTLKIIKYGGRVLLVVGMGTTAYEIYAAEDRAREVARQAGGWAGAYGGAWLGGKAGVQAGFYGCSWAGVATGPCMIGGGFIGAVGGGWAGAYCGMWGTTILYDKIFTPVEIEEYEIAPCQDDENAGAEF